MNKVNLLWKDKKYSVEPEDVISLIAEIEEIVTLEELANPRRVKRAKVAMAFCAALRFAGCVDVTMVDVYRALFNAADAAQIEHIIATLITVMIPPDSLTERLPKDPQGVKFTGKKSKSSKAGT